jgi:hypothetical protein
MAEKSGISRVALLVAVVAAVATLLGAAVAVVDSKTTRALLCTRYSMGCIRQNIFTIYTLDYPDPESTYLLFLEKGHKGEDCLTSDDPPNSPAILAHFLTATRKITKIATSEDRSRNLMVTTEGHELFFLLNSQYPPIPTERTLDITVKAFRNGAPVTTRENLFYETEWVGNHTVTLLPSGVTKILCPMDSSAFNRIGQLQPGNYDFVFQPSENIVFRDEPKRVQLEITNPPPLPHVP